MLKLLIDWVHVKKDPKLVEYIDEKIGKLDHLLPLHARKSAHGEVWIKTGPGRGRKQFICEIMIHLPKETINTSQSADSPNAAVDMAEAKLKNQLKRYKDKHTSHRPRFLGRFRGGT